MKAYQGQYPRGRETLADDALCRHISEMATVWHAQERAALGDGRATLKRLHALRTAMAQFDGAGECALRCAAQHISQVMTALKGCAFAGRLPAVGREARVRLLARELCAHSELKLSARRLLSALETFESVEPMEAEEIWALNAAFKLELGDEYAAVCALVVEAERARLNAEVWADRIAGGARVDALGERARSDAFYERLARLLSQRELTQALDALRRQAAHAGVELDEAARRAQSDEAQCALLLRNAAETLHMLERIDWRELSCALGSVHLWLMRDPAGVYPRMDFESRQLYISAVSEIARLAGISQDAVARACVVNASEAQGLARHVGYHLVDERGRARFIETLGADSPAVRLRAWLRRRGKYVYMYSIIVLALGALVGLCALGLPAWLAIPGAASALTLAQLVVNRLANLLKPRMLPRIDLPGNVPEDLRTLVVIPALLSSAERACELVHQLEAMAALESDGLDFLLLGDYADSARAREPDDAMISDAARIETERANARAGKQRFYYLQREREFNDRHDRFMGHERKRGALMALNRLLLGGESAFTGDVPRELAGRYTFVITLDADTRVPPGALKRLIGALAHPLNRFTLEGGRAHGYSVLQPRMELSLGAVVNRFVRVMAGEGGFDAYQSGVSEAYWDVSGTAAYAGKGIYDLRAFDLRLRGVLPDNAILSHDLIEGIIAGAGYASDVPLYDGFPATLGSYLKRLHRWTRGDWQLIRYLGREVPTELGPAHNALGMFDRWKIFANLFRSLCAPLGLIMALLSLYMGSWPGLALALTPYVLPFVLGSWNHEALERMAFRIAIWPMEAACQLDAIARTLYRVYSSGRNMLEWVTSADAEAQRAQGGMRMCVLGAALCVPGLFVSGTWVCAAVLGAAFAACPWWTRWLEQRYTQPELSAGDSRYLSELARDTWRYFEQHVSENGLPPDNVQLEPPVGASMRTSPTDTGMYMASCVAACELGLIGERELLARLARTLRSLEKMDKWRGHMYNWVDIQTLEPLSPRYVSTVDSGNLLGCLYLCRAAMDGIIERNGGWGRVLREGAGAEKARAEGRIGVHSAAAIAFDKSKDGNIAGSGSAGLSFKAQTDEHSALADEQIRVKLTLHSADALAQGASDEDDEADCALETGEAYASAPAAVSALDVHGPDSMSGGAYASAAGVVTDDSYLNMAGELVNGAYATMAGGSAHAVSSDAQSDVPGDTGKYEAAASDAAAGAQAGYAEVILEKDANVDVNSAPGQPRAENTAIHSADEPAAPDLELLRQARLLRARICALIDGMDFKVLYDARRDLFHIGINAEQGELSRSYYDLLGSEARLASFAAMMKGDVPPRHFAALGRACVRAGGDAALVSWSGTMFEYFMPHLLMAAPRGSLLAQTLYAVLGEQMRYADDLPWGVSESGYYGFDELLNYQYKAFGLPTLALSGGDAGAIAPYAAEMTAQFAPAAAVRNLRRMQQLGLRGDEGFFEALDREPGRLPEGARYRIVKSYMAHHKGMALLGMTNALSGGVLVRMFMGMPEARALALLLEERRTDDALPMPPQPGEARHVRGANWLRRARRGLPPEVLLMSGPDAQALVTADGRGYLRQQGRAINRWRGDVFNGDYGFHVYARIDGDLIELTRGQARFEPGAASWTLHAGALNLTLEMCISPSDGALLEHVTVENGSGEPQEIELTGYFELALLGQADDEAHPGFHGLFVQTESPMPGALLFKRRARDAHSPQPLALSMMVAPEDAVLSCDSSRRAFLGREYCAAARELNRPLSGSVGRVLDPCSALRARFAVPGHSRRCALLAVRALSDAAQAADVLERYSSSDAFERAVELSRLRARAQLEYLGMNPGEFNWTMDMAARLAFADLPRHVGAKPVLDVRGLWRWGISGDRPLAVLRVTNSTLDMARRALRCFQALHALGMECDLVLICELSDGYQRGGLDDLKALAQLHGGAYVLEGAELSDDERALLREVAAAYIDDADDAMRLRQPTLDCADAGVWPEPAHGYTQYAAPDCALALSNGWGGFDAQGGYVIDIGSPATPAPWVNMLAGPEFGMIVAENGGGFVWHGSSREGRLTRWRGDPLRPGCEQILYLRDERTGEFNSLTPEPCGALPMRVRHAPGETRFYGRALDVDYELALRCDAELNAMYMRIKLTNSGAVRRQLSLTGLVDWVMGERTSRLTRAFTRGDCALCVGDMPGVGYAAFVDVDEAPELCVNMLEFIGVCGDKARPEAMLRPLLRAQTAPGSISPCAALRTQISLDAGDECARTLVLGWAESAEAACAQLARLRAQGVDARLEEALTRAQNIVGRMRFGLPDVALERMINDWLPYQTQVSRLWARAGYYQPGGAYGFRDQLQDLLAIVDTDPRQARAHILRCAAHQFRAGDVQHWWHEPYRGVRTRITDDMLFLPYLTALYVEHTGDAGILDETAPYLEDVEIPAGAEDIYCDCTPSDELDTLRGHCLRAIRRADTRGEHGLPLMGAGDWNDGMNRVGAQGRGESVWLGMFMCEVLRCFAPLSGHADELMRRRDELMSALEAAGWDGQWYRRAYYDDGTPLGSATGEECRIDLLSQAWAALAGLDERRVQLALDSAWDMLVDEEVGIVRLLTPPFDDGHAQPGYIKGYLPGIRENGGQYTHAAVWLMLALIKTGQRARAWRVLELLLPPNHARTGEDAARYAVEPYVLAADVYGVEPYEGRGGWTWYTGSAAWLTYAIREHMLGLRVRAGRLKLEPQVPEDWREVSVSYVYGSTRYVLHARRDCITAMPADELDGDWVKLSDDGRVHEIVVPLK